MIRRTNRYFYIYIQNFARNDVYTACHIFLSCVLKKFEKGSKRKVFQMNKSGEDDILNTLKAAGISRHTIFNFHC